ncbi:rod shape-determining protein [Listeria booriae]|uniref:rod shape-determining protein n=1 Tax=Listeria booriae TaxID=1552123 RepID=UPI0016266537|nr:rod shape-determining protein [Listeria booriae]MBC2366839.1 rod shape-determining protein [Listeria booriae]MBC2392082.1 rod shape-determining protein [Listeria booriae]
MFSHSSVGIDLGTANIVVYNELRGIMFNEPAVIVLDAKTKEVYTIGTPAKQMYGKTPTTLTAIKPLKDGVVADFDNTVKLLQVILERVTKITHVPIRKTAASINVPAGATIVERNIIRDAVLATGIKVVTIVEAPVATAIGAGLPINEPVSNMIVNIGAGITEISIVSYRGILANLSIRSAGDTLDEEIIQYFREKHHLLIGNLTAEKIKKELGFAPLPHVLKTMEVGGRSLLNGLPELTLVTSTEIQPLFTDALNKIVKAIHVMVEQSPAELSGDIMDQGIILTGGGSLLNGFKEWLTNQVDFPVILDPNPLESTAIGTGRIHFYSQRNFSGDVELTTPRLNLPFFS